MSVSKIILQQMGGSKFTTMTGAQKITALTHPTTHREYGLGFHIPQKTKNNSNWIEIILNASDYYDVTFYRINVRAKTPEEVKKQISCFKDIDCEMLQTLFTDHTGLHTHL